MRRREEDLRDGNLLTEYTYRVTSTGMEEIKMILWERFEGTCLVHECFGAHSSQMVNPEKLRIAHFRKRVMGRGGIVDNSMVSLTNQLKKALKEM